MRRKHEWSYWNRKKVFKYLSNNNSSRYEIFKLIGGNNLTQRF